MKAARSYYLPGAEWYITTRKKTASFNSLPTSLIDCPTNKGALQNALANRIAIQATQAKLPA